MGVKEKQGGSSWVGVKGKGEAVVGCGGFLTDKVDSYLRLHPCSLFRSCPREFALVDL